MRSSVPHPIPPHLHPPLQPPAAVNPYPLPSQEEAFAQAKAAAEMESSERMSLAGTVAVLEAERDALL